MTPTQDQHDAKNKLGKYQTMLEELDEDEEGEVGENEVAEEVLGKEDRNWERIDLGYSPEESDDFFSIRLWSWRNLDQIVGNFNPGIVTR